MQVVQTRSFLKIVKKLHVNQKQDLDRAVELIINQPTIGDLKLGDLAGVFVYKFKMNKQTTLLAYHYNDDALVLTLMALGSHENFYRDLKQSR